MVVGCEKFGVLFRDLVHLGKIADEDVCELERGSVGAWIRSVCLGEHAALGGGFALSTGTRPRPENLL